MQERKGFTLVELLMVIALIGVLATLVVLNMGSFRAKSRLSKTSSELASVANTLTQYAEDNNYQYPAEVGEGETAGLEPYLENGKWPKSAWANGIYDYDAMTHPGPGLDQGKQIYQITYRLCGTSAPDSSCSDPELFPNFTRSSSIYYCVNGPCIPHPVNITAPAWCVNCKQHEQNPPL